MTTVVRAGSDLGRRVRERRSQLGLSVEQVAAGASIDPGYLDYLESAADPDPSRTTLMRLAVALQTSVGALSGTGQLTPPGSGRARPDAVLEPLSADECMTLIAGGGVGRFVFLEERGPVALPVNYRMLKGDIVFRTAATSLALRAGQRRVSFEVDHIDEGLSEGWSVLVSGEARLVTDPSDLAEAQGLVIQPWPGGDRDLYYRLRPVEVSGRLIRSLSEPGP